MRAKVEILKEKIENTTNFRSKKITNIINQFSDFNNGQHDVYQAI